MAELNMFLNQAHADAYESGTMSDMDSATLASR